MFETHKAIKAIEFKDGYYWVKTSSTSATGYKTKREAKAYIKRHSFTLGYLAIAMFAISAICQIVVFVAKLMA